MSKTPKFEKRHLEYIADVIRDYTLLCDQSYSDPASRITHMKYYFADKLEETNPKFNKDKFLERSDFYEYNAKRI